MKEGRSGEVRGKSLGGREEDVRGKGRTRGKGGEEVRRGEGEGEGKTVGEATPRLHLSQNFVCVVK